MKLKCSSTEKRFTVGQLKTGEVYKHNSLPGLYLAIPRDLVDLRFGLFVEEVPQTGWIHCPNAICIEEPQE